MKYFIALLLICSSTLFADIGEISALKGSANLFRDGEKKIVVKGMKLEKHDKIKTAANSRLQIVFNDKTVISLGQESELSVDEYLYDDKNKKAGFSITKGFFKSITGKIGKIAPKHFKIRTANATIGVRGTTIIAETTEKLDIIACSQGQIEVISQLGSVIVNQGERTIVAQAKAPTKAQKINNILLKQLDKKSDPSTIETTVSTPTKQINKETKQEDASKRKLTAKEEEKSSLLQEETILKKDDLDTIKNIIGTQTPVYEGKITQGKTGYGKIKENGINSVTLGFDLGSATMDGSLKFEDKVQQYDISVAGKVKDDGSFSFNSVNGYDGGGKGKIEGERFEHANGEMNFVEQDLFSKKENNIEGKFETTLRK